MPVQLRFYNQQTAPRGQVTPLFRGTGAARVGAAITRAGAQLEQGQREWNAKVERQQAQDASTLALRVTAETRAQFANRMTELQENGEPGLPDFTGTVGREYQQHVDQALESVPEWARERVGKSLLVYGDTLGQQALGIETKARWSKRADDLEVGIKSTVDAVERSPGTYENSRAQLVEGIEESQLPPAMRAAAMENVERMLPAAYARGLVASNPGLVSGSFNGRFESRDPVLNALPLQTRMQIKARADTVINTRMASARADLSNRTKDIVAATAAGNGDTVKPVTQAEYQAAFGPVEGLVKFKEYRSDVDLAALTHTMKGMDSDQLADLVMTADSKVAGEGAAEGARIADVIRKQANRIESMRRGEANAARADLAGVIEEEFAAAMAGEDFDRLSLDAFLPAYTDTEQAQNAYREWITSIDALEMRRDIQDDSPAEAVGKIKSRFDDAMEFKTAQKLIGEVQTLQQRREEDPAGQVMTYSGPVRQAWVEYNTAETPEDRRSAARQYAETMIEEQERIGVPADKRRLLPDGFVEQVSAQFAEATAPGVANGQQLTALVQQYRSDFGDRWPEVVGELIEKKALPSIAIPIASGMDAGPARLLASTVNMKWAEFNLKQGDGKLIDDAVTTELGEFRTTLNPLNGITNGPEMFGSFHDAARRLAYNYTSTGMDYEKAAKRAAQEVVTGRYHFENSYRVPNQAAVNAGGLALVTSGAAYYKAELAKSRIGVVGTEAASEEARQAAADNSVWVTAPDESGLVLMHGGYAVPGMDGNPIALPWSELSSVWGSLSDLEQVSFKTTSWLERRF